MRLLPARGLGRVKFHNLTLICIEVAFMIQTPNTKIGLVKCDSACQLDPHSTYLPDLRSTRLKQV